MEDCNTFTVTAGVSGGHGRISPEGTLLVFENAEQTFQFIPDDGYKVEKYCWTVSDIRGIGGIYLIRNKTATFHTGIFRAFGGPGRRESGGRDNPTGTG